MTDCAWSSAYDRHRLSVILTGLGTLANQISLLVPVHDVEADYSLWRSALGSYSCTTVERIASFSR